MHVPDNYEIWQHQDDERERQLEKRPECADCGQHVQDDYFYLINDEVICPDCLEAGYRREIDDYVC